MTSPISSAVGGVANRVQSQLRDTARQEANDRGVLDSASVEGHVMDATKCGTCVLLFLRIVTVLAASWFVAGVGNAGEDRTYWNQGLHIAKEGERVLIAKGICASSTDCQKKQLLFLQPISSGIEISIYGVNDASSLQQITSLCMQTFYAVPGVIISLRVFAESKQETIGLPIWKSASPTMTINFSRRK